MKAALIEARGDIFIASQLLGVTPIRLTRAIQVCQHLQVAMDESRKAVSGVTREAIEDAISTRVSLYRVVGLDALHDLATMPIDVNSAQNQVKLAAAARLVGETSHGQAGGEMAEAFRELNLAYQEGSKRIRVVRQTLVEIEGTDRPAVDVSPFPE